MADDEEVPVDGPNGRVTFHANSNLAELAGDVQHHPQQHHAAGPTDYGHLSMRAKSAIRKPAIRGVSALPSKRAKSAFRKPGAGGSRPESSVKDVPSRGQSEGEEEGPVDRGIMKKSKKKKDRDKKNPFRMPALHTFSFEHLVHNIVWRVGRNFGFQAFNINPATKDRVSNWVGRKAPSVAAVMCAVIGILRPSHGSVQHHTPLAPTPLPPRSPRQPHTCAAPFMLPTAMYLRCNPPE